MIEDANILFTDRTMLDAYSDEIAADNNTILQGENISNQNLISKANDITSLSSLLKDHFFFIYGSSNFHHIDIANLFRLRQLSGTPFQLFLIDRHMDCFTYDPSNNILHCGNWVSYAFFNNLIKNILIIGAENTASYFRFDKKSIDMNCFHYYADIRTTDLTDGLNSDIPSYLSIDTDILDSPNDWGIGPYPLNDLLSSSFWNAIGNSNLIGASIGGHVTDNRKTFDMLRTVFSLKKYFRSGYFKGSDPLKTFLYDVVDAFSLKAKASLNSHPLPIKGQKEIILSFYNKILKIR